jgi:hypothetical protein
VVLPIPGTISSASSVACFWTLDSDVLADIWLNDQLMIGWVKIDR